MKLASVIVFISLASLAISDIAPSRSLPDPALPAKRDLPASGVPARRRSADSALPASRKNLPSEPASRNLRGSAHPVSGRNVLDVPASRNVRRSAQPANRKNVPAVPVSKSLQSPDLPGRKGLHGSARRRMGPQKRNGLSEETNQAETSADGTPAEIPEVTPAESTEETPAEEETSAEITNETPTEITEETPAEITEETSAEITEETPAEISEETSTEVTEETPGEITDKSPEEGTEENPAETTEETPEESPAGSAEETPADATSEEPPTTPSESSSSLASSDSSENDSNMTPQEFVVELIVNSSRSYYKEQLEDVLSETAEIMDAWPDAVRHRLELRVSQTNCLKDDPNCQLLTPREEGSHGEGNAYQGHYYTPLIAPLEVLEEFKVVRIEGVTMPYDEVLRVCLRSHTAVELMYAPLCIEIEYKSNSTSIRFFNYADGHMSDEQSHDSAAPLELGKPFSMEIITIEENFEIKLNGENYTYPQTISFEQSTYLEIHGAAIENIEGISPITQRGLVDAQETPLVLPIHDLPLKPEDNRSIGVGGIIQPSAAQFEIVLQNSNTVDNYTAALIKLTCDFQNGKLTLNHYVEGNFDEEETHVNLQWFDDGRKAGQPFYVEFHFQPNNVKIVFNGNWSLEYNYKLPLDVATHLAVKGDIKLNRLTGLNTILDCSTTVYSAYSRMVVRNVHCALNKELSYARYGNIPHHEHKSNDSSSEEVPEEHDGTKKRSRQQRMQANTRGNRPGLNGVQASRGGNQRRVNAFKGTRGGNPQVVRKSLETRGRDRQGVNGLRGTRSGIKQGVNKVQATRGLKKELGYETPGNLGGKRHRARGIQKTSGGNKRQGVSDKQRSRSENMRGGPQYYGGYY